MKQPEKNDATRINEKQFELQWIFIMYAGKMLHKNFHTLREKELPTQNPIPSENIHQTQIAIIRKQVISLQTGKHQRHNKRILKHTFDNLHEMD